MKKTRIEEFKSCNIKTVTGDLIGTCYLVDGVLTIAFINEYKVEMEGEISANNNKFNRGEYETTCK